jgi:transposase
MAGGQKVVRVPPKMMAQTRASARTPGKSDPIDALAVARASLREPDLPIASHDEVSRELKVLVDRREVLVAQRTSTINRLLWRVHELDPSRAPKPRSLDLAKHRRLLGDWLVNQPGLVAELARDELADIARLTAERVRTVAPTLLAMPGCGELTAAKLVGEAAGVTRSKAKRPSRVTAA